jgi:hypothetical protein
VFILGYTSKDSSLLDVVGLDLPPMRGSAYGESMNGYPLLTEAPDKGGLE